MKVIGYLASLVGLVLLYGSPIVLGLDHPNLGYWAGGGMFIALAGALIIMTSDSLSRNED